MAKNRTPKNDPEIKKNKKYARRLAFILIGAFVVLTALNFIMDTGILDRIFFGKPDPLGSTAPEIEFYDPDYNYDIKNDADYMALDKYIAYTEGGMTLYLMRDSEIIKAGENIFMFKLFFDSIISGNAQLYNSFFSEDYIKVHGEKSDFTMQRIYDIRVELYDKTVISAKETQYRYLVSYKIMKNDGTFRRDIGSDTFDLELFTLSVSKNSDGSGNILITNIE